MPICSKQAARCGKNGWVVARHNVSLLTDTPLSRFSLAYMLGEDPTSTSRSHVGAAYQSIGDRIIGHVSPSHCSDAKTAHGDWRILMAA
jgi:hypothetical protein